MNFKVVCILKSQVLSLQPVIELYILKPNRNYKLEISKCIVLLNLHAFSHYRARFNHFYDAIKYLDIIAVNLNTR